MSAMIEVPDMQDGYLELIEHVIAHGTYSKPRDQGTIECEDVTFRLLDVTNSLPTEVGRNPNLMIAAIEALQLIGGVSAPDLIVAASRNFERFRESDGSFWGAYGKRVHGQYANVLRKLDDDRDSRQAVVTLWDPALDNQPGHPDYPCTIALGFRIRRDRLNMSVTMRSNDVWLGTCYDVFQFTQLQQTLARELTVEPGTYTHTAWSLHIYDRDIEKIGRLTKPVIRRRNLPTGLDSLAWGSHLLLNKNLRMIERQAEDSFNERWYHNLVLQAYARKMKNDQT